MSVRGAAILCGLTATSAWCREAESNLNQVLDLFSSVVEFKDVALTADGDRVAWSETVPEKGEVTSDRSVVKIASRTDLTWNTRRVSACPETVCEERSYGGYMAMWTGTQTNRFRAAVAGAGISNWQSYYGQNRIDQWMIPYFGASVYDDPAIYARSSPINFIKQTKTPTLILQGERDAEVPAPQAYEYWHALKVLGVPTQLVIYPDEGHHFRTPEHRRDLLKRIVGWFDRYLRPPPG